ncbi:hypothetical protein [Polaromonas sp.]|uniref:hypothetical protein n=1 Tax=Polaromonas sp. TaxID=1869339 RepID=UPI003752E9CA
MNSTHRAASHAKRRRWPADTLAWAQAITASQDQQPAHADKVMDLVRTACDRLKDGTADAGDYDRVAAAFNVALIRAESIDPLVVETMNAGIVALLRCDAIWQRHRKYGFHGPDLEPLEDAMGLYEQILRLSTPRMMEDAVVEAARRMLKQSEVVS